MVDCFSNCSDILLPGLYSLSSPQVDLTMERDGWSLSAFMSANMIKLCMLLNISCQSDQMTHTTIYCQLIGQVNGLSRPLNHAFQIKEAVCVLDHVSSGNKVSMLLQCMESDAPKKVAEKRREKEALSHLHWSQMKWNHTGNWNYTRWGERENKRNSRTSWSYWNRINDQCLLCHYRIKKDCDAPGGWELYAKEHYHLMAKHTTFGAVRLPHLTSVWQMIDATEDNLTETFI